MLKESTFSKAHHFGALQLSGQYLFPNLLLLGLADGQWELRNAHVYTENCVGCGRCVSLWAWLNYYLVVFFEWSNYDAVGGSMNLSFRFESSIGQHLTLLQKLEVTSFYSQLYKSTRQKAYWHHTDDAGNPASLDMENIPLSGQTIATSRDLTPNAGLVREIPGYFKGI